MKNDTDDISMHLIGLERAALDIWKLARARDDDAHPEAKRSSKRRKTRATSASTRREPAALRRRS